MALLFKILFIILQYFSDVCMVVICVFSLHVSKTGEYTKDGIDELIKHSKKAFTKFFVLGIVVKALYWLFLVGSDKVIVRMFYGDGIACALVLLVSLIYMLPLNKISKENRKVSVGLSISWIIKVAVAVLILFVEAYFMAAPVIK